MNIHEAVKFAMKNKDILIDYCSCYYCLKQFRKNEIKEWTDQGETALCPYCHIDSVIPDHYPEDFLQSIHAYWFKAKGPDGKLYNHTGKPVQ